MEDESGAREARGGEGIERALADQPDVILVSSELRDIDCLSVCRRLRESRGGVPVLVLSWEARATDSIAALNAGADDHLPRDCRVGELQTRLRALARRGTGGGDRLERLTRTEFELLQLFLLIYERVWGHDFALAGNTLRVYVGYLRKKLEAGGRRLLLPPAAKSLVVHAGVAARVANRRL